MAKRGAPGAARKHIGFKAAEEAAREGGAYNPGGAIAEAARNASPAAKRANPRLKRVKGA